jgi:WD40 repeat protein/pSer/pThr/pTyr-binding forkhead associated (FHA) protein
MILSRVLATETVVSINLTYERELEQAQAALDRHHYVAGAQHIRKARSQPGYSRSVEALNAWASLYICLPRKAFLEGWESATFAGQTEFVNSLCLSEDNRFALSGSNDNTLKLWEVDTGRCLRTFAGHTNYVTSVCLSADSRFALSGSNDNTLKLWEVDTGRCLRTFAGHTNYVTSVCLSADSRFALSGSWDKSLKLWEVATGRCLRTFEGHTDYVGSVCLSGDNRFALSGGGNIFFPFDKTLKLWEVATGRCLRTFAGHISAVLSVCLSGDNRFALSGGGHTYNGHDKTLKLWEVATGRCLRTFEGHTDSVKSVCLSADSRFALSGSTDRTMKLWEVETGRCLRTFEGHTDEVSSVCLSTDSRFALSASKDKTLKLWVLDWELEDQPLADWDKRAQPYLENFLTLHTPYAATLPENRDPIEEEITLALTRRGTPTCTEEDFKKLLYTLGCAGYGWLRPEGVRQQLKAIAGIEPSAAGHTVAQEKHKSNGEFPNSQLPVANSQSNQMPAKVTLTVTEGSLKGREFVFDSRTTCIIGRAKDCNPQLPDDAEHNTISRYHCLLDINPPDIRIRDFGSKNGTYVNDQKIGQRQPDQSPEEGAQLNFPEYDLKAGDTIKLGNTVFQVSIQVDNQATQTPNLVNTPVYATKIAPEPPKFSEVIKGLLQQADAGESKLLAIRGYTTLRELGQGGCGAVYLARHDQTSELVALKVMLSKVAAKPSAIDMFLREIENNKALQHPNVVQLRAYGYDNGTFFFTLDYCNGGSVADLMRQRGGKLSIDEAVPIILQTLDGLNYAHNTEIPCVKCANGTIAKGRGLVHRDLKPHNILLANVNGSRVAKIADYGLAKAFDLAGLSGQTMTGHAAGTPRFMPRQQVINFKHAKPEVDVWAVAASLYNMLTGAYPRDFGNQDPFLAVLQTNPVLIRQRDALIPKRLAELIDLALVDNPEIHFKNAAAFKRALESVV